LIICVARGRRAGLKDVTPHTLRHTAATWKAQSRVPLWEAAGFLGMSRETLEKVYGHHDPDHLRAAAEAQPRPRNVRGIDKKSGLFGGE
jgi:integrase